MTPVQDPKQGDSCFFLRDLSKETQETHGRHPGDIQETSRRHPNPGGTQSTQEDQSANLEKYNLQLHPVFATSLTNGRASADIRDDSDMLDDFVLISTRVKCSAPSILCESGEGGYHQVLCMAAKNGSAARAPDHHPNQGAFINTVRTPFR